eukprot:IDg5994t1
MRGLSTNFSTSQVYISKASTVIATGICTDGLYALDEHSMEAISQHVQLASSYGTNEWVMYTTMKY